jgi:serine/threonine-protein kinase
MVGSHLVVTSNARVKGCNQPGDILAGKYLLEGVLGQGGMGTVWSARNLGLDSVVAVKVLSTAVDSLTLRERLLREAQAAAQLTHPAIVRVFDVGETERGEPFIVMELLRGCSLAAVVARDGRVAPTRLVQLLLPIADALSLAHEKGIVHRDVKPDNIFIADDEGGIQPKMVDFGIVKRHGDDSEKQLTRAGDVMGSPDYMSPEQARGDQDIGPSVDVWAFSVVLYEALAGNPPFVGPNYNALLWQIQEATPAPLHELGVADLELSSIVARGLSKQAAHRFSSMREMGSVLAKWLMKQGLTEDACGTAVESKWFPRRGPLPHAGGGAAPEPTSGARLKSGEHSRSLMRAAAMPPPRQASARARSRWPSVVGVAGLVGAAAMLLAFAGPHSSARKINRATTAA